MVCYVLNCYAGPYVLRKYGGICEEPQLTVNANKMQAVCMAH